MTTTMTTMTTTTATTTTMTMATTTGVLETTMTSATTAASAATTTAPSTCQQWCQGDSNAWSTKCAWKKCKGCDECGTIGGIATPLETTTTPVATTTVPNKCQEWCAGHSNSWSTKCTWKSCKGCDECETQPQRCEHWCAGDSDPW